MSSAHATIHIFPEAPPKPALGAPCNGCGVCCLMEPCPLGVLLCGKRFGACLALRWQADKLQYRCGAITQPREVLNERLAPAVQFLSPWLAWLLGRGAKRWVAAGVGCDCHVEVAPADPAQAIKD